MQGQSVEISLAVTEVMKDNIKVSQNHTTSQLREEYTSPHLLSFLPEALALLTH